MSNMILQLVLNIKLVPVAFKAMIEITVKDQLHHVKLVELINRMPDHNTLMIMLGQLDQKELRNLARKM